MTSGLQFRHNFAMNLFTPKAQILDKAIYLLFTYLAYHFSPPPCFGFSNLKKPKQILLSLIQHLHLHQRVSIY